MILYLEEWRLFSRAPFVFFSEPFLAKYDKEMKKSRGVYYTPPPVVNLTESASGLVITKSPGWTAWPRRSGKAPRDSK